MGLLSEMENMFRRTSSVSPTFGRNFDGTFGKITTVKIPIERDFFAETTTDTPIKCPRLSDEFVFGQGDSGRTFNWVEKV